MPFRRSWLPQQFFDFLPDNLHPAAPERSRLDLGFDATLDGGCELRSLDDGPHNGASGDMVVIADGGLDYLV